jgi:hypothetical protein
MARIGRHDNEFISALPWLLMTKVTLGQPDAALLVSSAPRRARAQRDCASRAGIDQMCIIERRASVADLAEVVISARSSKRGPMGPPERNPEAPPAASGQDLPSLRCCEQSSPVRNRRGKPARPGPAARTAGSEYPARLRSRVISHHCSGRTIITCRRCIGAIFGQSQIGYGCSLRWIIPTG